MKQQVNQALGVALGPETVLSFGGIQVSKKKQSLIEKISNFIEKHFRWIIIGISILIVITPIVIWLCYSIIKIDIPTEYTADGLLSFFGSLIAAATSLLVACVALYQSKRATDANEELEIEKRRTKIKPCLQVEIIDLDDEVFEIVITNHSSNAALGVYLFEYPLFPAVTIKKEERRKIVFSHQDNNYLHVSEVHFDSCEDGTPKELLLVYLDADNNVLVQKFQKDEGSSYNPCEVEYY